ncbi:TPA: hypothetical protein N0F65_007957 [Lagenidium giganteum]|uniref:Uncharacterized protein n=1 Tax=Lagenidium giganteum TaxID=4803 RepID=A0AAV2YCN2_9STRA|nr:TPA: hypothetical protein N0F65_007957 [Lagenidium giganteum]
MVMEQHRELLRH